MTDQPPTTTRPVSTPDIINRLLAETPLSMNAAARLIGEGRSGRPLAAATVFRWCTQGVTMPDGTRLRLEGIRIARTWRTSREALARFLAALNPAPADGLPVRTPTARRRAAEDAERELIAAGA
jgi:hypothetical protein